MIPSAGRQRFVIHGLAVHLRCWVPALGSAIPQMLEPFAVPLWPASVVPATGWVGPYDLQQIQRSISASAKRLVMEDESLEVFQLDEQFWCIDERWGMCEINFLKSSWRSWVLPGTALDAVQLVDRAVMWPMAQVLRGKGLHLLPAISAVRDGWAFMLVGGGSLEPELRALLRAGYRIIGQKWTALREEEGRVGMLHVPGQVKWIDGPSRLGAGMARRGSAYIDLMGEFLGSVRQHAFCDAVLMAGSGRRAGGSVTMLGRQEALGAVRENWPMVELHPMQRQAGLAGKLARSCAVASVQLGQRGTDLLEVLDQIREETRSTRAETKVALPRRNAMRPAV